MFETWKLNDFAPGEGAMLGVHSTSFDDSTWLDVPVPGDVHRALIESGRIEDPFYDRNESKCRWIEDREWWYRLSFLGPEAVTPLDDRLRLVFHGLDTYARVWLNGESLGLSQNMFREAVFDVSDWVKPGQENILAVCFDRPLDHVDPERLKVYGAWGRNPERVFMRKAQFGFGWDWGPRLPTVGIWRPVELRRERRATIKGVHFKTILLDRKQDVALVAVRVEVERLSDNPKLTARVRLDIPGTVQAADGSGVERTMHLEGETATAYLEVKHPQLWWTHDLGEPALHSLTVSLCEGADELDERKMAVGIRTLTLDQSPDPDERGTRFFRFILNGVPLFARGADWIPCDSFVGAIPNRTYETLLQRAKDAHMNMLRVWGGGIYEHNIFYDLCDRLGLLVWQDFMFACAMYPEDDPEFVREVEAEAIYQVERLRSHPSLALWCGNNENHWIHDQQYWDQPDYRVPGSLYYHTVLPRVVEERDGQTAYWPGTPYGGNDYASMEDGNRHNWQVWHGMVPRRFGEKPVVLNTPEGVSYGHYAEDTGRFISEYGMHAAPVLETLRRAIPHDQLHHHSESMDHHNKDFPKNKGDNLMLATTGLPATLEDYIDFSMIAQAEGLKFGIEHFRRRKPHCSGSLFWQLNDCWPGLSWSVLDYYGVGKAGYYYVRRAYAPVLASFKALPDGAVELWITNDTLKPVLGEALICLREFGGDILWTEPCTLQVPENTSMCVCRWEADRVQPQNNRYLSVSSPTASFEQNRHFFGMIKDLEREPTPPRVTVQQQGTNELSVTVEAKQFAYFVHIETSVVGVDLSDNFFDVEPGQTKTIRVRSEDTLMTPDAINVRWR